jgi:zinc transporter, ZIP family
MGSTRDVADAVTVFLAAFVTALATGLGALPLLVDRLGGRQALGIANAAASGVMLGASASLLFEGVDRSVSRSALGVMAGVGFIVLASRYLRAHPRDVALGSLHGEDAVKGLLIVAVMTVHSVAEGVGVGAAFGGGETLGFLIALAIAVHNIPEGLAISLVLVPRGVSVARAAGWSVFSSLPQPLMAVPAFLFVETFEPLLPIGLGFAAGAMVCMVAITLLPEAMHEGSARTVAAVTAFSTLAMIGLQLLLLS